MLNRNEKTLARILFQKKIHESEGQAFEDLFTKIMNHAEPDFIQIKPWSNTGDRKNDGYIKSKGIYFQVYAPEDIRKKYSEVIAKLKTDFSGLLKQWNQSTPIKEFYFVVNDKYKGVSPDAELAIRDIVKNNNLSNGDFKTAKDLENLLFNLSDDQIQAIVGYIPNPTDIHNINYSILNEVILYIMQLPIPQGNIEVSSVPDWNAKIKFNDLCDETKSFLEQGYIQVQDLEKYLSSNGDFLATELCKKMIEIYSEEKRNFCGDVLFWKIVEKISPKNEKTYMTFAIMIMAKYFESCDIFEKPIEDK